VAALREKANTTATARCASGETLVSGEYAFVPSSGQSTTTSFRDYAASASKWTAMAVFLTRPAKLAAFAYCERGVVVKVRSSSSASIPHESDGSATARCHKGETLLSGGYTTTPTPDWHDTAGPDLFYSGSFRSGVRSWTAAAINYGTSGKITAFAYCMP
jgi:hypothetical protein